MKYETAFLNTPAPVTVLTTHGDIDGSNYRELIAVAQKLYQEGTRNLLLDLADTPFMSSSGMVALHSIALMMQGGKALNVEDGWAALREMGAGLGGPQAHLKLLNAGARIIRTLDISGLKDSYEIFTDREAALASFLPQKTAAA